MHYWNGGHLGWMGLGWVFVFFAGLAFAWFLWTRSGRRVAVDDSPEIILERRFSRGELERDEYETRLARLRK